MAVTVAFVGVEVAVSVALAVSAVEVEVEVEVCGNSGEDFAVVVVVVEIAHVVVVCFLPSLAASFSFFGTGLFLASAAFLNFVHSLRCPPFFQWFTWHSRPQYCTVWHNLQGFNGRNGVLGLPQVEQQRMVGVVRPSCLSNS